MKMPSSVIAKPLITLVNNMQMFVTISPANEVSTQLTISNDTAVGTASETVLSGLKTRAVG